MNYNYKDHLTCVMILTKHRLRHLSKYKKVSQLIISFVLQQNAYIIIFLSTNAYYFEKEKINVMRIIIKNSIENNETRQNKASKVTCFASVRTNMNALN